MFPYRLYSMTPEGHFTSIVDLDFSDDDTAIAAAEERLAAAYAIDVFCDGRRVARIESEAAKRASG